MALSNIPREPRREITETLVGLAIILIPLGALYWFGRWISRDNPHMMVAEGMLLGVLLVFFTVIFLGLIAGGIFLAHALGDAVCTALQNHGVHLRPRQRW